MCEILSLFSIELHEQDLIQNLQKRPNFSNFTKQRGGDIAIVWVKCPFLLYIFFAIVHTKLFTHRLKVNKT